jgi:hypothetical protein
LKSVDFYSMAVTNLRLASGHRNTPALSAGSTKSKTMGNYSSRAAKYGRQRISHPRHPYFRDESRREVDVTEMTL